MSDPTGGLMDAEFSEDVFPLGPTPEELAALEAERVAEAEAARQAEEEAKKAEQEKNAALKASYGSDFPIANGKLQDKQAWVTWTRGRWEAHRAGPQDAIFAAQRNRLFRSGIQWISSTANRGAWKEPPMPKDVVRAVDNQIGPALDWSLQIMSEQRPGFRFTPTNNDPDRQRKAQAMQLAVEYQYHAQKMRDIIREAGYWAQTDGVAFFLTFWDPEDGPWEEYEAGKGAQPMGDVGTKVYTIEQVRVSAEATATKKPMYWVLRDVVPLAQAVAMYGPQVANELDSSIVGDQTFQSNNSRYTDKPLLTDQRTVDRYTLFCDKSTALPEGLTVIVVGNTLVYGPAGLICGRVPVARMSDGSSDPSFYPRARINEAIAPQMRVNMILSKWIESVRVNSGGRFVSKTGAVVGETFLGGQTSIIEVRGAAPISETLQPINGFSLGSDAKELLQREMKAIQDITGWNDNARGQYSTDQSGRAILAIREQLERTFAPFVYAVSESMSEWAQCVVAWMRWGYQMPRLIGVIGGNRPDLAREFSAIDFDGVVDVHVDPETLMPMPRTLKLYLLDQDLDKGVIDIKEYRRKRPMAYLADSTSPDEVQEAKAKRVAEQIRLGQPPEPIVWQDDEAIQQDILERDIILAGDAEPETVAAAQERWSKLAEQFSMKQGGAPPAPDGNAPPADVGQGTPLPPMLQPTFGSNSGLPSAPPASANAALPSGSF